MTQARRPWLRRLKIAGLVFCAIVAVGCVVVAWFVADRVRASFAIPQPPRPDDLEVVAIEGDVIRYRDTRPDVGPKDVGRLAMKLQGGGWLYTAEEVSTQDGVSARRIEKVDGAPPKVGELAQFDLSYFPLNPRSGLGLEFEEVTYPGPLGDYPAWYVPGPGTTWLIYTHGRGSTLREGLRVLEVAHRAGHPALLISYRNDEGAPRGDGVAKFGVDEWQDLEAAIAYARTRGAAGVVLGAGSMGGAITLSLFENASPEVAAVRGVFLDSPALAIGRQSRSATDAMGVPGLVAELGFVFAAWRFGLDWEAMDYLSAVDDVTVPMLVLHGDADSLISVEGNRPVFDAFNKQGNATIEIVAGAQHLGVWNRDRAGFERRVSEFLLRVGDGGAR
jgi:alpha-beta hydrolase superfamily lysophospholipase